MNWNFLSFILGGLSLLGNIGLLIGGWMVSHKIMNNDLKHLSTDVNELKQNDKEYRIDLKHELVEIKDRLSSIELNQTKRDAVCEERHSKK